MNVSENEEISQKIRQRLWNLLPKKYVLISKERITKLKHLEH